MFIPLHADVPMKRWPWANYAMIGVTVVASFMFWAQGMDLRHPAVLTGWDVQGLFLHMFAHAGPVHLLGNMLFLFVFGNTVCAKVGNLPYIGLYLGLGLAAAVTHLLLDGNPAIGASGAVNGVVGMYLVFFPLNTVTCFYFFFIYASGTFQLSGFWLILLWLAFDLWGAVTGSGGIAYWAHLGGFAAGFSAAALLLASGLIRMHKAERSLVDVATGSG